MKLHIQVDQLFSLIPHFTKLNTSISTSSVGWHISHTAAVANKVIEALQHSNPANYRWQFNLKRTLLFTLGKIPRGKIQAPAGVKPADIITEASLIKDLQQLQRNLATLNDLSPSYWFKHPFLGQLNKKQTLRFLYLHTQHHLNIIHEILNH